ncbi:MAG: fibrobacter succinogenes major paralogous domain-containing protein [Paludibacteraceae bacterium]
MKALSKIFFMMAMALPLLVGCEKDKDDADDNDNTTVINGITYGTMTDIDGNTYKTVKIGTQTWMAENLKTTKYNDGTAIPNVTNNDTWWSSTTGAYCWYNNDISNKATYGALYNWYAVNTGKLAPKGWHVPTDAEWTTLENYLIANGYNYDGSLSGNKIAKALASTTSTTGWSTSTEAGAIGNDLNKNNRSGFSALPGGSRYDDGFDGAGKGGYWWSSTQTGTSRA